MAGYIRTREGMRRLKIRTLLIALLCLIILNINCGNRESKSYFITINDELSIGVKEGSDDYMFGLIQDVCTDDHLNIYVLDGLKKRVAKYDKDGNFKLSFGEGGEGPGQFDAPQAIAFYENKIYVLDFFKIHIFSHDGEYLSSFPIDFRGIDIDFNARGQLLVLGPRKQHIIHVFESGELKYSYGELFDLPQEYSQFKDATLFRNPLKIYCSGNRVYFMNPYKYEIIEWDDSSRLQKLLRNEPEYLTAKIKIERGGHSAIAGRYFICEKNNELLVFYTKRENKYGFDIWANKKIKASFEMKNIPVHLDSSGNYYQVEAEDYPEITKSRIEILKKKP